MLHDTNRYKIRQHLLQMNTFIKMLHDKPPNTRLSRYAFGELLHR